MDCLRSKVWVRTALGKGKCKIIETEVFSKSDDTVRLISVCLLLKSFSPNVRASAPKYSPLQNSFFTLNCRHSLCDRSGNYYQTLVLYTTDQTKEGNTGMDTVVATATRRE